MLIKCPKCRSVYDLPDNLITDEGLKLRCSECMEIWVAYPEDALKKVNTAPKNIQKMFKRISKETDDLFIEEPQQKLSAQTESLKLKNTVRKNSKLNIVLSAVASLLLVISLYAFRYDIVHMFPQTESLYSRINIKSIPYGADLEFNNITTKEYIENNIAKIEISGMVANNGKYTTELPPIKIDIFDKSGKMLLSVTEHLSLPRLESGYHILFNTIVTNPTPLAKSIYVTFDNKDKIN